MHAFRPFDDTGNRRSACDRCRGHKLRCERSVGSLQCRRCAKAHTQCVTSAALKSGRPVHLYMEHQENMADPLEYDAIPIDLRFGDQQTPLAFPTPPSSNLDRMLESDGAIQADMADMNMFGSPIALHNFDATWTDAFEQRSSSVPDYQVQPIQTIRPEKGKAHNLPSDKNLDLMKRLGELQIKILADLETVKSCGTAGNCSDTPSVMETGQNSNYLIGNMLDNSTNLIEILDCFQPFSQGNTPISDENEIVAGQSDDRPYCNTPLMLLLSSSYVSLVRIYRTILSCIYDSLPFFLGPSGPKCDLFPGLDLGGFRLATRIDLQIQILLQVSEDMLDRIEVKLGISNEIPSSASVILDPAKGSKFLVPMLQEEANEQPPLQNQRGACPPLRQLLAEMKQALTVHSKAVRE
ncbi:hypothetical protein LTR84_007468 [Exophiala bonariae]|uniref:Zn(2)-C6 fungal-type domain-containing protein n=1 Tax=Exophiala bonariae TaxID=1690606 RepID=A0AAV9MYK8_9EURO|nr:hypothetical protein LTR84_007468 [Exophiala bonariae]